MEYRVIATAEKDGVEFTFYIENSVIIAEKRKMKRFGHLMKIWYRDGKIHREDGPAVIIYNLAGNKRATEE